MFIYHLTTLPFWEAQAKNAEFEAQSLHSEGFIHCSYEHQIAKVIGRYFQGIEQIIVLTINPELLTSLLKAESSTENEVYPHIYGTINKSAIVGINPYSPI